MRAFLEAWEACAPPESLDEALGSPNGVSPRYAKFLFTLVEQFAPQAILEVGLANGVSAAFLATAQARVAPEGRCVAIDPFQSSQWSGAGRERLAALGHGERVRVIEERSYRAIPQLEDEDQRFDLAFVDGNHCLDYVLSDVLLVDRVLNLGGLIVLDDAPSFGVALAIPYLDKHRPNLRRIRFESPMAHSLREHVFGRRRLAVYQKVGEDERGPDAI